MAARFWVGGTSTWDATAGTKWALTSGGTGGQVVPTASDDVHFDANSGAVTVTVAAASACLSINFTGFTGTFAGASGLTASGAVTLASTATFTFTGGITLTPLTTSVPYTSAGASLSCSIVLNAANAANGIQLQDNFVILLSTLTITKGVFDDNNRNVNFGRFICIANNVRVIKGGSGTWTQVQNTASPWNIVPNANLTFTAPASLVFQMNSNGGTTFAGGGVTYNNVSFTLQSSGTSNYTISGSNTFSTLSFLWTTLARSIFFTAGTTQTLTSLVCNGISGDLLFALQSTAPGSQWSISCPSGVITASNVSIQDGVATGGAQFFAAANSKNLGNNSGWIFTSPGAPFMQRML